MKIELVRAWPRRSECVQVELPEGACVLDALREAGLDSDEETTGYAVFGVTASPQARLHDGDRVELLRSLSADPKEARRRRAQGGQ